MKTIPNLEIIYGHFLSHPRRMPLAGGAPGQPQKYVEVIKTEEKGSDVNLAAHLLNDSYQNRYQVAVVISNDSDLVEPIRMVRHELRKSVIVLNPNPAQPSAELKRPDVASFVKPIRRGALAASQFPPTMQDANGIFTKPATW